MLGPPTPRSRACALCGKPYTATGNRQAYCTQRCQRTAFERGRQHTDKRKAVKARMNYVRGTRRSAGEEFAPTEIAERDGWRCGLCDQPINAALASPDPMALSIDHVVPVSRGGEHTRANVQAAHLRCNVVKGNRVAA